MRDQGGASISDTTSPWIQPGFLDLTELLEAPPCRFPGRKYLLSQVEPGTIEPSCVIASGVSEEMGALPSRTLMGARKTSTRRLYASNGVFVKESGSYRPDYLHRMFWVSRCTDWIVDRFHRHWSLCRGHCRVRSPSGQSFGKKTTSPMSTFVSALGPGSGVRALSLQPFGFLTSVGLKELFLKITVLLAFASAKRIEHLHAFSVDSGCIRFGPGTAVSLSGRGWNMCLNHCLPPSKGRRRFAVSPCY